ncbi:hypothetical protein [Paenibacillus sp. PCH8]|uniref:hypothetical protein n=1 Tax=Paenibacillus sp. PCH8 TaxID=2066524 RepID=UPI0015E461A8|nr:hypothetical protein [Paenibacillus sp. PCH8]
MSWQNTRPPLCENESTASAECQWCVILYSLFVNDRKVMYPATDSICFQQHEAVEAGLNYAGFAD